MKKLDKTTNPPKTEATEPLEGEELSVMMGMAEFLAWAAEEAGIGYTEHGEECSLVRMLVLLGEYFGVEFTYEGQRTLEEAMRPPAENPADFFPNWDKSPAPVILTDE